MEALRTLIQADLDAVEQVIRDRLASEVPLIRQVAEYLVSSGGKRLRPALVVLSAGASGYLGRLFNNVSTQTNMRSPGDMQDARPLLLVEVATEGVR